MPAKGGRGNTKRSGRPQRFLVRNDEAKPDREGVVHPFLTRVVDGKVRPIAVVESDYESVFSAYGRKLPVEDAAEVATLDVEPVDFPECVQ